jgi:hypothetical protein
MAGGVVLCLVAGAAWMLWNVWGGMMADRPIIFSGPMVRALLDGRKAQTRRVLKVQPPEPCAFAGFYSVPLSGAFQCRLQGETTLHTQRLPYVPGDRLYVREAFAKDDLMPNGVRYVATDDISELRKKRPSIHMPRWASRITLTVTDVRVQRLQKISEADAAAEGVWGPEEPVETYGPRAGQSAFRSLWNSLHGPEAWAANPWVVAVSFTVAKCNIDGATP